MTDYRMLMNLNHKVKLLKDRLDRLNMRLGVRSYWSANYVGGRSSESAQDRIDRILDLKTVVEERLKRLQEKQRALQQAAELEISFLPQEDWQTVMHMRFLEMKPIRAIATEVVCSEREVYYIIDYATSWLLSKEKHMVHTKDHE